MALANSKLFLDGLFGNNCNSPSMVRITMPNTSKANPDLATINLTGLMTGDPSFSAGNKWGTILQDLSNLAEFSSIIGSESMWSWIGASTMCWKGTNPLGVGFDFYLINYAPNMSPNLEDSLKKLVKFAALERSDKIISAAQVTAHGGYQADILSDNNTFFNKDLKASDIAGLNELSRLSNLGKQSGHNPGALQVQFGNKLIIRNLLLSKIDVTASNIEVANLDGSNRKPLFYRVQTQFTGVRPLLTGDVDYMFSVR